LTAKKRVHIVQGIRVLQVGNWRRNVGAAADRREFEDLGPLFAVSARNSVQVFTFVPGVFPCSFSDGLRRSKPQSAAGRNGNIA
jgi:hypothetical protein